MCGLCIFSLAKKMNYTAASQTLSKNCFPLLSFLVCLYSLRRIHFPHRCHLLWYSDIFLKDSHAQAIQTLHAFKTQWQQAPAGVPPAPNLQQNLWNRRSRLLCPGQHRPSSEQLRTLAGSVVLYINSAAALSAAETPCLTGDVLASRGPSRWVPGHCRTARSLLAS